MTGFGAADGIVAGMRVSAEVRSVNHRFFNPSLKLPSTLARFEGDVREAMRRRIPRGHVTLTVRIDRDANGATAIDERKFAAYVQQLRGLKERFALGGELDVATVLRMPEVFAPGEEPPQIDRPDELVSLVESAVSALMAMRAEEGRRLAGYLAERLDLIEDAVDRLEQRAPERLVEHHERLRAAVQELAGGVAVDPQRLAQEVAILADRMDVGEELARFRSHLAAFREALASGGDEPVGKRLGFLLQELLREANTTGSKSSDVAMLGDVMSIKEEIERIREQVENVE
ncbi:MAG TPA: YicC/YloC family endoribonuclease [Gemmatimonadaceae bacterium]